MAPEIADALPARLAICSTTCSPRRTAHASPATPQRRRVPTSQPADATTRTTSSARSRARETPAARFCWQCRKPLHARTDRCPVLRRSAIAPSIGVRSISRFCTLPRTAACAQLRVKGHDRCSKSSWWLTARSADSSAHATICQAEESQWLSRHRQNLDEREARGLGGRDDPRRLPRHPLRQRRLRGRALLRHAARVGVLPPRRPHATAVSTPAKIYRMELAARPGAAGARPSSRHPRQPDEGLLHPPDRLSRLRHARRQPAALPGGRRDHGVGVGRVPGPGRARKGRRRARQLLDAPGARTRSRRWRRRRPTTRTRS